MNLLDPRFECKEYVMYLPHNVPLTQQAMYMYGCYERVVYKIDLPGGGLINTRVFNKAFQNYFIV